MHLIHKGPPKICSRRHFRILPLFFKGQVRLVLSLFFKGLIRLVLSLFFKGLIRLVLSLFFKGQLRLVVFMLLFYVPVNNFSVMLGQTRHDISCELSASR